MDESSETRCLCGDRTSGFAVDDPDAHSDGSPPWVLNVETVDLSLVRTTSNYAELDNNETCAYSSKISAEELLWITREK